MAALANVARNGLRWTSMSLKRTLLQTEQCMDESSLSMAFSRLFRMEISSSSAATSDVMRKESMFHKTRVEQRQLGQVRHRAISVLSTIPITHLCLNSTCRRGIMLVDGLIRPMGLLLLL